MNRYDILLKKLPINDISVVRNRQTGEILRAVNAEKLLVLGDYESATASALLKDALQVSQLEDCRHIEYVSREFSFVQRGVIPPQLASNPCFFCTEWEKFQHRGLKSSATALYLDGIHLYLDLDGSLLPIKTVLSWASRLEKTSRIVASCNLSDFLSQTGCAVAPGKLVVNKVSWTTKVL